MSRASRFHSTVGGTIVAVCFGLCAEVRAGGCENPPAYGAWAYGQTFAKYGSWGKVNLDPPFAETSGSYGVCDFNAFNDMYSITNNAYGRSRSYASLSTGRLKAYVVGTTSATDYNDENGNLQGQSFGNASAVANARFRELIYLHVPTASDDPSAPNYVTNIKLETTIAGFYYTPFLGGLTGAYAYSVTSDSDSLVRGVGFPYQGQNQGDAQILFETGDWIADESASSIWVGEFSLRGRDPVLDVSMQLNAMTVSDAFLNSNTYADFWHTATFAFKYLPEGTTFTSLSGVFLQGEPNGAPEPGTLALLGLGLAGLAAARRRRQ